MLYYKRARAIGGTQMLQQISRQCKCVGWLNNIEKVNAPIILQSLRCGNRFKYDGERFEFCPWCGKKLEEFEKDKTT